MPPIPTYFPRLLAAGRRTVVFIMLGLASASAQPDSQTAAAGLGADALRQVTKSAPVARFEKPGRSQKYTAAPTGAAGPQLDVSGGFAGTSNGLLIIAGHAPGDTPDAPVTVAARNAGGAWAATSTKLPAWAGAVQWGQVVICVGGVAGGAPTDEVMLVGGRDGLVTTTPLTKLPEPLAGASAAVMHDRLYVTGGIRSLSPLSLNNKFYTLDLNNPSAPWREIEPLPAAPRAFAAITVQYEALCLFGGLVTGSGGGLAPTGEAWSYRLKPPEGTLRRGWARIADLPRATCGAVAFPLGQAALVLAGGAEAGNPFPAADVAAMPQLYHVVTDAWCAFEDPLAFTSLRCAGYGDVPPTHELLVGQRSAGSPIETAEFKPVRTVAGLSHLDFIVIICYFGIISVIGVLASRHQKSSADFSLGGRRVPWWVAGVSMFATGASAISFMAIPAQAFGTSLVFLFPVSATMLAYFVQSRAIFPMLRRMEITSTYEYLERRFNTTLRLISSAQCIIFQTFGRAAVVLVLPSLAISATTGISAVQSVIVMGVITTVYTALGGFHAVVWTDLFQGILKFSAPVLMIILAIFWLPGGSHEFAVVGQAHHKFDFFLPTWDVSVPAVWILFINTFLAETVVKAGDQPVIQRVFSSPAREVRRVAAMSVACSILIACVVNILGLAIYAWFHANPAKLDPLAQNDKIVPLFVVQALPHGFAGVVIAAIFASAMTTVASSMNSSATVFTEDFFLRMRPNASDKTRLRVLRAGSYTVGVIAIGIAIWLTTMNITSLFATWNIISALLGGGIVGVYSLGMFTKRANGFGAVCGAIISIVVVALVKFNTPTHWAALTPLAIFTCMFFGYFLSFFSTNRKDLRGLTVYTQAGPPPDGAEPSPLAIS